MKSTIRYSFIIFLLTSVTAIAQNVVTVDSTGVAKEMDTSSSELKKTANDTVKPFKRFKAEGVAGVIGEYVIVEFDIDLSYIEMKEQGVSIDEISRCQMLGKLMEDKLYAHHAKLDSILIPDAEINGRTDQQMQYLIAQLGSEEKAVEYYRKDNIGELRQQLFDVNKNLALATEMQRKVTEEVEITPEEVREFFYKIPEDERPIFGAEVEVSQIVIEPQITKAAEQEVIDRLNEIRAEVVEGGASFATRAVLYSKDGSASKGGLIPAIKRNSPYAKEFKDMAFSLLEGEVSEPFETSFGWHILYVEKIRGQEVDVRHIILFPQVSQSVIDEAKTKVEKIREGIVNGDITFAEAARVYSDEAETRNNGGKLVNPVTGDTKFDLTKMDPTLGAQVYNLKEGEVSKIYTDRDYTGKSVFKILTVTNRYDEHPADYAKDYEKIQDLALKEKKIRAIEEWQNKKIKETYVHVDNDYKGCDFSSGWIKE